MLMLLLSLVLARREEVRPLEVYVQLYQQLDRNVWNMEAQIQKEKTKLEKLKFTRTFRKNYKEENVRVWMLHKTFHLIEYKNIPKYINLVLYVDPENLQMPKVGNLEESYEIKLQKKITTVAVSLDGQIDGLYNYLLKTEPKQIKAA